MHLRLLEAADRPEAVQEDAADVTLPTPSMEASTALTTTLLRMSARNASYQELCMTSSLKASAAPASLPDLMQIMLTAGDANTLLAVALAAFQNGSNHTG